jgi:muconolactone delta-isomerase
MQEAHHFYPVLFYFRFRDPYYSVSRSTLVSLDVVTLIKSALADQPYAWLKQSVSVAQLWEASLMLVTTLLDTFRSGGVPAADTPPDAETLGRWRRRYAAALRRLQQAGIQTVADERAGAEVYASLRVHWDHYVAALAPFMAYRMDEIDPAGCHPDSADQGRELRAPLRSAS